MTRHQSNIKRLIGEKFAGNEPVFEPGHTLTDAELGSALNWYNYMYGGEYDRAIKFLTDFYDGIDKSISVKVRSIIKPYRVQTYGWVARILTNGYKVEQGVLVRMREALRGAILESIKVETAPQASVAARPNQDRRNEQKLSDLLMELEDLVYQDEPFSLYDLLVKREFQTTMVGEITTHFDGQEAELREALAGKSRDLKEAYSSWTKARLKARIATFEAIRSDCDRYADNKKATRKPRKKRTVPVEKKLKAFHFLAKADDLKLASVNPAGILGAKELYTFDTKSKRLTRLTAEKDKTLDIKGSSLLNVDLEASISKRCGRKQAEVLEKVLSATKVGLPKIFNTITSAAIVPTARINSNTVLLRIVKP